MPKATAEPRPRSYSGATPRLSVDVLFDNGDVYSSKFNARIVHRYAVGQFVHVLVAVTVEINERWNVQCQWGSFIA